jgi:HlyD family secretion protein
MKSWIRVAVVVVGLIALSFLLKATVFRPKPIEVEATPVARGVVEDAVTNSQAGTVRSRLHARVSAERSGRVMQIPHREGEEVRTGDLILLLDTSTAENQLSAARRDLEALRAGGGAARAAATFARQDYDRISRLAESGAVSRGQLDSAKTRLDSAEAELKAAEARVGRAVSSIRLAEDELAHLRIQAPFDAVITTRLVEVGESVVPGQPVFEIMSPDSLYVVAPIDEIDIGRISEGLPARVSLDPFPNVTWDGTVRRVSDIVNDVREQNRTLDVEVDLRNVTGRPRPKPGTSADVEIILDKRENVIRVPTFAVIEGKRVLLAEDGKAVSRDVTSGLRNWEWTEIRAGLAEGDLVITNLDKQGVEPGVRITVTRSEAAPAGGTPAAARQDTTGATRAAGPGVAVAGE